MITAERLARYKQQAIKSVRSRAENPNAPGVSCINVSPHDLLDLILNFEEHLANEAARNAEANNEEPTP